MAGGLGARWAEGAPVRLPTGPTVPHQDLHSLDATIRELQAMMRSGELTSSELTQRYLQRIARLNPTLHAVLETNPQALQIAAQRDRDRRRGITYGPLHGIPILVKDNIATDDRMETTAGSLALVGSRVPADAQLVANLRASGAVILGKANLSEWANFRGNPPADFPFETNFLNGWSGRGGFTLNPYVLNFDPCGSSSGSATSVAAGMCAAAIGTETDGSIVCPAGNNLLVGLKPTVGLISGRGIIPIAHSQDSAGPMARSVTDVALLLNALSNGVLDGRRTPRRYERFLQPDSLRGARIGIERRLFAPEYGGEPEIIAVVETAITAMRDAGATIVDPVDTGDPIAWSDAEFTVLLYEFKHDIEQYLRGLRRTSMRTLGDLIRFNIEHCEEEMKYFGQEVFELAEATGGDLSSAEYREARALGVRLTREEGIDRVMRENGLDAVLSPSYGYGSSAPAVAGYPIITVPVGLTTDGVPAGVVLYAGYLQEPKLLSIAYGIEQLLHARSRPRFLAAPPPEPPDAGICTAGTGAAAAPWTPGERAEAIRRWHGVMPMSRGMAPHQ